MFIPIFFLVILVIHLYNFSLKKYRKLFKKTLLNFFITLTGIIGLYHVVLQDNKSSYIRIQNTHPIAYRIMFVY